MPPFFIVSIADFAPRTARIHPNHFLSRRVRGKKYFSACKCASAVSAYSKPQATFKNMLGIFLKLPLLFF
jgi:hypothetical protein